MFLIEEIFYEAFELYFIKNFIQGNYSYQIFISNHIFKILKSLSETFSMEILSDNQTFENCFFQLTSNHYY